MPTFADGESLSTIRTKINNSITVTDNLETNIDAHLNTGTAATGEVLSWNGTDYDWVAGGGSSYTDADVDTHLNTSTAATGEVLSWNGTDYDWVAGGGSSYTDADVDTHLNTSTAATGEILSWNGTDYDWVPGLGVTSSSLTTTTPSATSSSAYASKGVVIIPQLDFKLKSLVFYTGGTVTQTVDVFIASLTSETGTIDTVVHALGTLSKVNPADGEEFVFSNPPLLTEGTPYAIIFVRTDGTSTSVLGIEYPTSGAQNDPNGFWNLGTDPVRYASTSPTVGDSPTDATSTGFPGIRINASIAFKTVPSGGTTGQVLTKVDGTDYNTQWATPSGGGTTPLWTLSVGLYGAATRNNNPWSGYGNMFEVIKDCTIYGFTLRGYDLGTVKGFAVKMSSNNPASASISAISGSTADVTQNSWASNTAPGITTFLFSSPVSFVVGDYIALPVFNTTGIGTDPVRVDASGRGATYIPADTEHLKWLGAVRFDDGNASAITTGWVSGGSTLIVVGQPFISISD